MKVDAMPIVRIKKKSNYSVISNHPLDNPKISLKAKGLIAILLSKPDDWNVNIRHLATTSKDGIDSVKAGLKELKNAGYVALISHRDESGKIQSWEYIVHENPDETSQTLDEQPQVDFPLMENPLMENPHILNTDNNKILTTTNDGNKTGQAGKPGPEPVTSQPPPSSSFPFPEILPDNLNVESVQKVIRKHAKTLQVDEIKNYIAYALANADKTSVNKFRAFLDKSMSESWAVDTPDETSPPLSIPNGARIKINGYEYTVECGCISTKQGGINYGRIVEMVRSGTAEIMSAN